MNVRTQTLGIGLLLAMAFAAGWSVNGWRMEGRVARAELVNAQTASAQAMDSLKNEQKTGNQERQHAADTQKSSDEFTQKQSGRDAQLRADLDRAKRLQLDAERRAATYRAQAQANAAAGSDLADRLETLDRHIVEGVEVVARLRGDLARRDDEVMLLSNQVQIERALSAE